MEDWRLPQREVLLSGWPGIHVGPRYAVEVELVEVRVGICDCEYNLRGVLLACGQTLYEELEGVAHIAGLPRRVVRKVRRVVARCHVQELSLVPLLQLRSLVPGRLFAGFHGEEHADLALCHFALGHGVDSPAENRHVLFVVWEDEPMHHLGLLAQLERSEGFAISGRLRGHGVAHFVNEERREKYHVDAICENNQRGKCQEQLEDLLRVPVGANRHEHWHAEEHERRSCSAVYAPTPVDIL
mmetsp:Transcript_29037/g.63492  ORF Transcript_29037/g.63492 Transcript_29037/m.63492 type:complete len:242 (+) Transcript_29037:1006-1731(+)